MKTSAWRVTAMGVKDHMDQFFTRISGCLKEGISSNNSSFLFTQESCSICIQGKDNITADLKIN
jgi:hypothetical protein